ncbi:OpgC domain-containing protein [Komagataeibacter rhaeticus]|uniref:OpgC family protein n=1 Tax=Komagataeibacter rhaeticus TaxID=215221 RepID=UPI0004D8B37F|nr:OpgC domain-containing protein [Komagataeibacter rhaeticus]KDU94855.1 hypothetical protein GLUCORHAEAF1_11245 [Komagataeibacter rhaeticus AF1]MBL7239327.1 OpgC domain-containing protein [Komagataeibacter rhaeticus]PYD55248.1 OpgC domain-containing protein [Komagataeibacter rhaeticus]GBQ16436.1 hypothetical protein AA16663_2404 [Komagataeibacter rhaeticus DSM 16663]
MGISTSPAGAPHRRDHRIDALRGVALLMMCIDHIPQDVLNRFTMRNIGFADAAEVFVLLAGYASWLAYGRAFGKKPVGTVLGRIGRRCWQLYVYQMVMVVVCISTIRIWRHFWPVPVDFLEPELAHGLDAAWRVLSLQALPGNLNILPLYIVLLLGFGPLFALLRGLGTPVVLGLSAAVWLVVNFDPRLNFPNWLDPDGWYFDPLAWQFLFVLGVCAARVAGQHAGSLPRVAGLAWVCGGYLAFSAVQSFPWTDWGLADLRLLAMTVPDKMILSPWRLLDVLALFYLVQSSGRAAALAATRGGQLMALFGRHSLEIFTAGTLIDLYARLALTSFGTGWAMQVAVNVVGFAVLLAVARNRERARVAARQPRPAHGGGVPPGVPLCRN